MKKEIPQGAIWGILAVVALGAIAIGMNFLNGAAGNNEPSDELQKKQAEATASRYQSVPSSTSPPQQQGQTGEAAAREAYRQQNPNQSQSGSGE
ncbi:MAG: hypothetical protein KF836_10575 [Fimbriimonadaceae bacterium]|nr:hypothetical protein [Fimbriimonadaceae bacterium]